MSNYLIEYMKAHLISIEQDNWLGGQAIATRHFIQIGEEHANKL